MSLTHPPTRDEAERPLPPDAGSAPDTGGGVAPARRAVSLVAAIALLWPAFQAWQGIVLAPATGVAVIVLTGAIFGLVYAIGTAESEEQLAALDRWVLAAGVLVLGAWASTYLAAHDYGTDEAAFTQGAATLLVHGHDPYGAHLLSWLNSLGVNSRDATYTMSGGVVDGYGYPALPVLVVAPFVWLTGGGQAVAIADLVVLAVGLVVAFRALPAGVRPLAVLLGAGLPTLANFAVSGLVEVIAMVALLVVAARSTDILAGGRWRRGDLVRAVALGLALSTNQLAWFVTPFLLVGLVLLRTPELGRARALRAVAGFATLAGVVFVAVNAPFIVWDPGAWAAAVAAPLTQHAIPYGQGLIGLTLFLRLGGGALDAFNAAGAALYLALLALYAARLRRLGPLWIVLPIPALFVSGRSLAGYWLVLGLPALVSMASARRSSLRAAAELGFGRRGALSTRALTLCFIPAVITLTLALTVRSPLDMRVLSATSDLRSDAVARVSLLVRNRSGHAVAPLFSLNSSGQALEFMHIAAGPRRLGPGRTAVYTLVAPDAGAMSPDGTPFIVQAVSTGPRAISSSAAYAPSGPVANAW